MSFFVVQATPEMVYEVSKNMRERDLQELLAIHWEENREQLAEGLAEQFGNFPMAFCLGRDNIPICILVAVTMRPGVWSMGMWATADIVKIGKELNNFAMNPLFSSMRACGMHRVECKSIVGYTAIHKWLRHLGFTQGETEKMYGKNKEDFLTFYWTENMPLPRGHDPSAENSASQTEPQKDILGDIACAPVVAAKAEMAELQNANNKDKTT